MAEPRVFIYPLGRKSGELPWPSHWGIAVALLGR
jgi:hypothetical protein